MKSSQFVLNLSAWAFPSICFYNTQMAAHTPTHTVLQGKVQHFPLTYAFIFLYLQNQYNTVSQDF